ncbi:hypothetical protein NDU88_000281 [Pleurodeles waltl]|uniref:Uncharacterized protein n=1 Tax=Pleurodeles waltl TaxID=8319 RepID=A0AAV7V7X1_PLEWA|nr:hypothetical protein NDU88_000281 [Pleurodeles waltl]
MQELIRVPLHLSLHLLPRNRLLTALEACNTATKKQRRLLQLCNADPAAFSTVFLVVHAVGVVCLLSALEAPKKSPVGRRNLPPATAGTKKLHYRSLGSPLSTTSEVPRIQQLCPSDPHGPVTLQSKFGGGKSLPHLASLHCWEPRLLQILRPLCTYGGNPLCTAKPGSTAL